MASKSKAPKPIPATSTQYRVDMGDLQRKPMNIGETREFCRIARLPMNAATGQIEIDFANADAVVAAAYIVLKRQNPRFTLAEFDQLDWDDVTFIVPGVEDAVIDEVPTSA